MVLPPLQRIVPAKAETLNGRAGSFTLYDAVEVQPPVAVTTTVYVPAGRPDIFFDVAKKLLGPVHE